MANQAQVGARDVASLRRTEKRLSSLALAFFGLSYITVLFSAFVMLRHGRWLIGTGGLIFAISLLFTARYFKWSINRFRDAGGRIRAREDQRPPILVLRSFME